MHGWAGLAWLLGGITLLGGAIKAVPVVWRGFWGFIRSAARVPEIAESLAKIATVADAVLAEFSTNGGGSLRDAIDRLEEMNVRAEQVRDAILAWQETHSADDIAQMAAVQARLAETLDLIVARTSVTRDGGTTPELLSDYTQDRLHDVLDKLTPIIGFMPLIEKRLSTIEAALKERGET